MPRATSTSGTGKSMLEEFPLTPGKPGEAGIDELLWNDIRRHFAADPGGHLYRYQPKQSNARVKLPAMDCEVEDLGIPVANNAVYALTASPDGRELYGLSYPDGHFFVHSVGERNWPTSVPSTARSCSTAPNATGGACPEPWCAMRPGGSSPPAPAGPWCTTVPRPRRSSKPGCACPAITTTCSSIAITRWWSALPRPLPG